MIKINYFEFRFLIQEPKNFAGIKYQIFGFYGVRRT